MLKMSGKRALVAYMENGKEICRCICQTRKRTKELKKEMGDKIVILKWFD